MQDVRRENHFWDGVFGFVGIRNHSEIDYTDPIVFNQDSESSEDLLKVKRNFALVVIINVTFVMHLSCVFDDDFLTFCCVSVCLFRRFIVVWSIAESE